MIIKKDKKIIDIVPFDLEIYKEYNKEKIETYSKAIGQIVIEEMKQDTKPKTKHEKKIEKIKRIIENQQKSIDSANIKIKDNQGKAESIYNNYKLVNEILTELKEIRKTHSWKEIKQKLKGHKIIKEINEKDSKIIIELN